MTAAATSIDRRSLLKLIPLGACGLAFAAGWHDVLAAEAAFQPSLWLAFDAGGHATLIVRKVEMGQGIHTAFRTLAAEELRLPPNRIRIEQATSHPRYGEIQTGGSYSIPAGWTGVRRAAAAARLMFEAAAAEAWKVDPATVSAADASVRSADGRLLAFADLVAAAARQTAPADAAIALTPIAELKWVSRRADRCHAAPIVDGTARYGIDISLPGMLHASIERAPAIGAKVRGFDDRAARTIAGYRGAIMLGGNDWPQLDHVRAGVAVLADDSWTAQRARERIDVDWDWTDARRCNSEEVIERMTAMLDAPGLAVRRDGMMSEGVPSLTADYSTPYLAHAPLEPPNAVASVDGGRVEVWCGTQRQRRLHDAIVRELAVAPADVIVHAPLLGGGFGRRLEVDYGLEAALLARKVGRPVKVIWTRGDDLRSGLYRSASAHRLSASLDGTGRIAARSHRFVGESVIAQQLPGDLGADGSDWTMATSLATYFYDVPAIAFDQRPFPATVPCTWWRGTQATQVQVVEECFMDELAALAGTDPIAFRLRHLPAGSRRRFVISEGNECLFEADRMRAVIADAERRSSWQPPRDGRAHGIACGFYDCPNTYTAAVAEVALRDGEVVVRRLTIAVDCGLVVDPLGAEAQVSGAALFGMGAALWQQIAFRGGVAQAATNADFRVPLLADTPTVEVRFIDSREPPSGLGEPATPVAMAAVANAVAALRGRPVRNFPLS